MIELLLHVAGREKPAILQELARDMALSKSTAHRFLTRLERLGVVERNDSDRRFAVGQRMKDLMMAARGDRNPRRLALPIMERLRDSCDESVCLHAVSGDDHIVIEHCECRHQIRSVAPIGYRIPLGKKGATAKAILAFMEQRAGVGTRKRSIEMPSATEVEEVRRRGYALSLAELTRGVISIAAPVFDAQGRVFAGLSVTGPEFRFTKERARRSAQHLLSAASEISRALGHV